MAKRIQIGLKLVFEALSLDISRVYANLPPANVWIILAFEMERITKFYWFHSIYRLQISLAKYSTQQFSQRDTLVIPNSKRMMPAIKGNDRRPKMASARGILTTMVRALLKSKQI